MTPFEILVEDAKMVFLDNAIAGVKLGTTVKQIAQMAMVYGVDVAKEGKGFFASTSITDIDELHRHLMSNIMNDMFGTTGNIASAIHSACVIGTSFGVVSYNKVMAEKN